MPGKDGRKGLAGKLVLGAVALAALYFLALGGEYTFVDLWRLQRQHRQETQVLDSLRGEVRQLQTRTDSLENDSAAVERIARERYGLIRDGERLYRFVGPSGDTVLVDSVEREIDPPER